MKKVLLLTLIIVVVAAGAAFAGIAGSKHDLTSAGSATVTSNINEICVFCHTPHAGNTGLTGAPLWNRQNSVTTWNQSGNGYSSTTMNTTSSAANTTAAMSATCLSCHDGNVADEVLLNSSGSGTTGSNLVGNFSNSGNFSTIANLNDGAGLTNDHPIGINMSDAHAADGGIWVGPTDTSLRLFGTGNGYIECATCHDVHNAKGIAPLLAMSNSASAMCLACHNK